MNLETRWLGRIGYEEALAVQEQLVSERVEGAIGDQLLLLEHDPVYTIGRTQNRESLRGAEHLPHPLFVTNRGGQATYHGPGQLIGYPILDLEPRGSDLHAYMRAIEQILIEGLKSLGVASARREGLTGVWIENRKIASIGVGIRRWITMHGFALNVCGDLSPYELITPCGIAGVTMTSIEKESGRAISVADAASHFADLFKKRLPELMLERSEVS